MTQQPTQTLTHLAADKIERAFPDSHTETARVVWWDDGGFLKEVVAEAASDLGVDFRAAESFPLALRVDAVAEERETNRPVVWYVAEGKDGRDWFRDIRETGGEITCSLEELTADLYGVNAWDLFDVERHGAEARQDAADIILERVRGPNVPQYDALKEAVITRGGGQLRDHLLRDGWPEISRDQDTVREVRERLRENHGIPIPTDAEPDEITNTVRKWAVAKSLIDSGVSPDQFTIEVSGAGHNPLTDLLRIRGTQSSAEQYLGQQYWPDVIDRLEHVWSYADCPVDGALDIALWDAWQDALEANRLQRCIEHAERRQAALSVFPDDTPWLRLWIQAEHVARLEKYFSEWDDRNANEDPFDAYADTDDGSWRIDNEVLQLQLTGTPEEGLQQTHPATATLPSLRDQLLTTRYRDYLNTLAEAVQASFQVDSPLVGKDPAFEWWSDHEGEFDDLGTVAVFLIDALRYDLAQRLADRLSDDFDVTRETRLATLPTETKFGMAALTPGRSFRFDISMEGDTLSVHQGDRSLARKSDRVGFYEDEGWEVPDELTSGWEHHHIAYYDKELDDVGEGEIGDVERHFSDYIADLSEKIRRKLDDENWDRIYVVTDHGFVLLPEGTTMESVPSNGSDVEVKYRRIAGDGFDGTGTGVQLTPADAGVEYLNTDLELLVDPRLHFSKQGYSESRYYHGGLLPQECVLSFLEVQ